MGGACSADWGGERLVLSSGAETRRKQTTAQWARITQKLAKIPFLQVQAINKGPLKEFVVATGNFLTASSAFRSSSSSKQSRFHYVGSIFGKYNYFITLYVNIVILITYHVIQRTDFEL
jgi:hypothetical protein